MLNKIISSVKNNYPVYIAIVLFSAVIFPLCFYNNNYLNLVAAEHIDSGSILGSILQLFSRATPHSFYNQNIPYHTLYGYLFNSILFWIFYIYKEIGLSTSNNFSIFAATARLFNFTLATLIIFETYKLSEKILKSQISRILAISLVTFFPPFIWYSYLIKTDLLGLYLTFLSFNYLYKYVDDIKNTKNIIIANILGGMTVLCKHPQILIATPLFFTFFITLKGNLKYIIKKTINVYLKSLVIFLIIFFLIYPYAFIERRQFIAKFLSTAWNIVLSVPTNISAWFSIYRQSPTLLLIVISPLILFTFLLLYRIKNKIKLKLIILSVYTLSYVIWITTKLGPQRLDAYFYPIFPFSIIVYIFVLEQSFQNVVMSKTIIIKKILYLIILISMSTLIFYSLKKSVPASISFIQHSYNYNLTPQSLSSIEISSLANAKNQKIIYSISLPIYETKFKEAKNSWQFTDQNSMISFHPDILFIDLTVYWEQPYTYWKEIATKNKLTKEKIFIDNTTPEKNIVLFYK